MGKWAEKEYERVLHQKIKHLLSVAITFPLQTLFWLIDEHSMSKYHFKRMSSLTPKDMSGNEIDFQHFIEALDVSDQLVRDGFKILDVSFDDFSKEETYSFFLQCFGKSTLTMMTGSLGRNANLDEGKNWQPPYHSLLKESLLARPLEHKVSHPFETIQRYIHMTNLSVEDGTVQHLKVQTTVMMTTTLRLLLKQILLRQWKERLKLRYTLLLSEDHNGFNVIEKRPNRSLFHVRMRRCHHQRRHLIRTSRGGDVMPCVESRGIGILDETE